MVPEKVEIENMSVKKKPNSKATAPPASMSLKDWFNSTLPPGMSKSAYAKQLAEKTGGKIAMSTVLNLLKGQRLTGYGKAKAVSDLTGGKVSEMEILET